MPTYVYRCPRCGRREEARRSMAECEDGPLCTHRVGTTAGEQAPPRASIVRMELTMEHAATVQVQTFNPFVLEDGVPSPVRVETRRQRDALFKARGLTGDSGRYVRKPRLKEWQASQEVDAEVLSAVSQGACEVGGELDARAKASALEAREQARLGNPMTVKDAGTGKPKRTKVRPS